MGKMVDITGQTFGFRTVIRYSRQSDAHHNFRHLWIVKCHCGKEQELSASDISRAKSCGCRNNVTHGMSRHPDKPVWNAMWNRVRNPNCEDWERYGGRGITVCDRWKYFPNFVEDMGPRTSKTQTIERINVNGNYEPSNCCWLENKLQALNTRRNINITIDGETKCMSEWCRFYNVSFTMIQLRVNRNGMTYEDALKLPTGKYIRNNAKIIEMDGVSKCLSEWIKEYNAPENLIRTRIKAGWDLKKALNTPSLGSNAQRQGTTRRKR